MAEFFIWLATTLVGGFLGGALGLLVILLLDKIVGR